MDILISESKIVVFDYSIIAFIQGDESPRLTAIVKYFTFIGFTPSVAVIPLFSLFFLYNNLDRPCILYNF
jgi:undecaprenyl-diphosphatase